MLMLSGSAAQQSTSTILSLHFKANVVFGVNVCFDDARPMKGFFVNNHLTMWGYVNLVGECTAIPATHSLPK